MQLWLIPALPLAGFVINGAFGRRFSKAIINVVAIGSVLLAFAWALKTVLALGETPISEHYFDWIVAGGFRVGCDFTVDRLTAVMLLVVTGVGSLIHIYSIGSITGTTASSHISTCSCSSCSRWCWRPTTWCCLWAGRAWGCAAICSSASGSTRKARLTPATRHSS